MVKYKTRTEFRNGSPGAYYDALNFKIMEVACGHMEVILKKRSHAQILEEIGGCCSIKEVLAKDRNLYMAAWRKGMLRIIPDYLKN